jgi:hypothetical protein
MERQQFGCTNWISTNATNVTMLERTRDLLKTYLGYIALFGLPALDKEQHLDVVGRLNPSMKWKPRIHSAPLTREPGRAVALGRVLVLT